MPHNPQEKIVSKTNAPIYQRPSELLQDLIRFDTTNPPGNGCVHLISSNNGVIYCSSVGWLIAPVHDKRTFPSLSMT